MQRWFMIFLAILGSGISVYAQEDLKSFKTNADSFYYKIITPEVKNFTCMITSDRYIDFIRQYGDSTHYYPIKFVWTPMGTAYVLESVPQLSDSLRRETLTRAQVLKNLFDKIFLDVQRYVIMSPLAGIPDNAVAKFSPDTVGVSYTFDENNEVVKVKHSLTRAGQIFRTVWTLGEQKILNRIMYDEVAGKWLCFGWQKQGYAGDKVLSGLAIGIEYQKREERLLPLRFDIVAQQREGESEQIVSGSYVIFLKDFSFNENIEIRPVEPEAQPEP